MNANMRRSGYYFFSFARFYFAGKAYLGFTESAADAGQIH